RLCFVFGNTNDPVVCSDHLVLRELLLCFLNDFLRSVVIENHIRLLFAKFLADSQFNNFSAGLGGLFDGLKKRVAVESVRLATNEKSTRFIFVRDPLFRLS